MADHMDTEGETSQVVNSSVEDETSRLPEAGKEASEATPVMQEEVAEKEKVINEYRAGTDTDERGEHPGMSDSLHGDNRESSTVKEGELQVSKGEYVSEDHLEAPETIFKEAQTTEHTQHETLEQGSQATWFTDCHADKHGNVQEGKESAKTNHEDDKKEETETKKCPGDDTTPYLTKNEALNIKSERDDSYLEMKELCQEAPTVAPENLTTTENNSTLSQEASTHQHPTMPQDNPIITQEIPTIPPEDLTTQDPTATEENPTLSQEATTHQHPTVPQDDPTTTQEIPTIPPEDLTTQDPTATENNPTLSQEATISQANSTKIQEGHAISHKPAEDSNTQNPTAIDDLTASQAITCQEGNSDTTEVDSTFLEKAQHGGTSFSPPEGTEESTQPLGRGLQHSEDYNTTAEGTTRGPSPLDITTELSLSSSQHVPKIQACPEESHPPSESITDVLLGDSAQQKLHSASEQDQQASMGEEPQEAHQSSNCLHVPEENTTAKCCEMKCVESSEAQNEETVNSKDAEGLQSTEEPMEEKDGSEM
uniref:Enolase-phosphatase E1-like isoform X2 n=1 Tax=Geotrypetes seraphini TaxID=260995 RepID=A0A6P8P740_GEOSA|nr:enolase-phosphatase E1-like isoform X2 [Geotrypetes seraphini]